MDRAASRARSTCRLAALADWRRRRARDALTTVDRAACCAWRRLDAPDLETASPEALDALPRPARRRLRAASAPAGASGSTSGARRRRATCPESGFGGCLARAAGRRRAAAPVHRRGAAGVRERAPSSRCTTCRSQRDAVLAFLTERDEPAGDASRRPLPRDARRRCCCELRAPMRRVERARAATSSSSYLLATSPSGRARPRCPTASWRRSWRARTGTRRRRCAIDGRHVATVEVRSLRLAHAADRARGCTSCRSRRAG